MISDLIPDLWWTAGCRPCKQWQGPQGPRQRCRGRWCPSAALVALAAGPGLLLLTPERRDGRQASQPGWKMSSRCQPNPWILRVFSCERLMPNFGSFLPTFTPCTHNPPPHHSSSQSPRNNKGGQSTGSSRKKEMQWTIGRHQELTGARTKREKKLGRDLPTTGAQCPGAAVAGTMTSPWPKADWVEKGRMSSKTRRRIPK